MSQPDSHGAPGAHDPHAPAPDAPLPAGKSFSDRSYLPEIAKGLGKTLKHFTQTILGGGATVQFPERNIYQQEEAGRAIGKPNPRLRGEHILVKDDLGREKCVACLLCMSACPALCIYIEPEPAPAEWKDRERRPKVFELDMLRCIYCGYCEEACPCDAIRLTPKLYQPTSSRAERVYDKPRLLENNPEWQRPQRPKK